MKKILFGSTALAMLVLGGAASAQGISLFGDARLGIGYNVNNEGYPLEDDDDDEDIRAISRVRFGVNMTGTTDSGITFGATIRADNAEGGEGGEDGQTSGEVFVSGGFGTLSYGDTNAADEEHIGDLNAVGLTDLGEQNETQFISNGGGFGSDDNQFAENPFARPTIRYDFDIAGFGVSLSSNRDLTDIGVGASWSGDFGPGAFTIGAGYYDFEEFTVFEDAGPGSVDENGNGILEPGEVFFGGTETIEVSSGEQWSVALGGEFAGFDAKAIYTNAESDAGGEFDTAGIGLGTEIMDFQVDAYYRQIIEASGFPDGLGGDLGEDFDGEESFGIGATYDLGGGARIEGGVARVFEDETVADFGIGMSF